jgi:hypothetical protein
VVISQKKDKKYVCGLKKLFLKRFTVRSTTRTLIINKNDHSALAAIIREEECAVVMSQKKYGCSV